MKQETYERILKHEAECKACDRCRYRCIACPDSENCKEYLLNSEKERHAKEVQERTAEKDENATTGLSGASTQMPQLEPLERLPTPQQRQRQ